MDNKTNRVFKKSLIVPISVVMVIVIHFGYILLNTSGLNQGILTSLQNISFEVLVLCEVGILSLIFHNKGKVDLYLNTYSEVNSREALETLKPIIRTNMYSALFTMFFLALGTLTAIMTIMNDTSLKGNIAAALCVIAAVAINWYNPSEQKLKQIPTANRELEEELTEIMECWMHKAFPNF